MKILNHHLATVDRQFSDRIKAGSIKSAEEVRAFIAEIKMLLPILEMNWLDKLDTIQNCEHEWVTPSFTLRRQLLGNYIKVFERRCKHCKKLERHTESNKEPNPSWCKPAREAYYNNDI